MQTWVQKKKKKDVRKDIKQDAKWGRKKVKPRMPYWM